MCKVFVVADDNEIEEWEERELAREYGRDEFPSPRGVGPRCFIREVIKYEVCEWRAGRPEVLDVYDSEEEAEDDLYGVWVDTLYSGDNMPLIFKTYQEAEDHIQESSIA